MIRIFYSIFIGVLIGTFTFVPMASAAALDITFRPGPGDYITSGDFCTTWDEIEAVVNHLDNNNLTDSAVTAKKLANNSVGNLTISDGAITITKLNYTDSSTWDTMPVRMYASVYTGDSTCTGSNRIYCGGLHPIHVEIIAMGVTSTTTYKYTQDLRWDTTNALAEYATNVLFSDTSAGGYGTVRITKADTEFVVYNVTAGVRTPNIMSKKYAYTVWGY